MNQESEGPLPGQRITGPPAFTPLKLLAAFTSMAAVFLALYFPSLKAGFDHRDDHEVLRFAAPFKLHPDLPDSLGPPDSVYDIAVTRDREYGRVRYMYFLIRFAGAALLGTSARAWHAAHVGIGILTCFFLYLALRRAGMRWTAAAMVVVWTVAQRGAGEVWFRTGPSEIYAMLFLAISLWATVEAARRGRNCHWDWIAVAAAVAMGFSKEPFVLMLPLLAAFRAGFAAYIHQTSMWAAIRGFRATLVTLMALFAVQLSLAVTAYQRESYSRDIVSQVQHDYAPWSLLELLLAAGPRFSYYIPVACALAFAIWALVRRRGPNWWVLGAMLLALTVTATQLPLLKTEWLDNRYFYPAAFGLALFSGIALNSIRDRRMHGLLTAACVVAAAPFLVDTFTRSSRFAAHTIALNKMFDFAEVNVGRERHVVLYANPSTATEASLSALFFLGYRGLRSPVYLYPALPWAPDDPMAQGNMARRFPNRVDESDLDDAFLEQFQSAWGRRPGASVRAEDVGAIIMLHPLTEFEESPPSWYVPDDWETRQFHEPYWHREGLGLEKRPGREHSAAVKRER